MIWFQMFCCKGHFFLFEFSKIPLITIANVGTFGHKKTFGDKTMFWKKKNYSALTTLTSLYNN